VPSLFSVRESRFVRGLVFIGITTLFWGVLPIFLKAALKEFSPETIAWFRFTFAFAVLFVVLVLTGTRSLTLLRIPPGLALVGGVCLSGNYLAMTMGIHFSGPSNAAILIQLAPVLLVVVGVFVFHESLAPLQVVGMLVAGLGLYLFYSDQRALALNAALYSSASLIIIVAAVVWVAYMACQKKLSPLHGAQHLNFWVYGTAMVTLAPFVPFAEFSNLRPGNLWVLVFLGLNTLIAYGTLAEAVKYIPLSIISVVTALNPLITLSGMLLLEKIQPAWLDPENISLMGYLGALTAIGGVVMVVSRRKPEGGGGPSS